MTDPGSRSPRPFGGRPREIALAVTAVALALAAVLAGACGTGGAPGPGATSLFGQGTPAPTPAVTVEATGEPSEVPTEEPTAEPTDEPTAEPTAAPTPAVTPSASATATPAGSSGGGLAGACDPDAAAGAGGRLKDLDSYRTRIRFAGLGASTLAGDAGGDVSIEAVAVRKPEPAVRMTISGLGGETASAELTYILVGERAWMEIGGTAIEMPGDAAEGLLDTIDSLSPDTLYGSLGGGWAENLERVGDETKNGVTAVHCRADATTAADLGEALGGAKGATWSMDLWVARDGGYLVGLLQKGATGSGSDKQEYLLQIDVSDVNSPANRVEAPE